MEPEVVQVRRAAESRKRLAVVSAVLLAVAACAAIAVSYNAQAASQPSIESMYHMWLGPNGLPLSPRKQRALLFQFCTTNFVTEAEMRYCYARLLSVGNPSGPVKFSGQPQYDSEQVVSPLFTFSAPPMGGGEEEEGEEEAAEAQVAGTNQLAMTKSLPAPALKTAKTARFGAVYGTAPTAALYQSQQKGAAPTRAGNAHVTYAAGYAAGLAAAKKELLHAQALASRPPAANK